VKEATSPAAAQTTAAPAAAPAATVPAAAATVYGKQIDSGSLQTAMALFSENDIRGIYPDQLDRQTIYRVGYYLPGILSAGDIVVGRDPRLSSEEIFTDLSEGIRDAGCSITDIGPCCTPSLYFANAFYGFGGSAMITASHNPPEYNGLKISGKDAVPTVAETGLNELEELVKMAPKPTGPRGRTRYLDITRDYLAFLRPYKKGIGPLRLVSDCSNGAAAYRFASLVADLPVEHHLINDVPSGRFPRHGPNPVDPRNLRQLRKKVLEEGADLGICFDGDGDRVIFVDELGRQIPADRITALLALHYFDHNPDQVKGCPKVLYDVRSSKSVPAYLRNLGATPLACPVGHALVKGLLRREQGLYAGELTGHYYFRDFFYCDSALLAVLIMLNILSRETKPLSELVGPLQRYFSSGELSFTVGDAGGIIERIRGAYPGGIASEISGLRLDFPDWWFILRAGTTEPKLRLVIEADSEYALRIRRRELVALIRENARENPS
jgi:phosphomannomutase